MIFVILVSLVLLLAIGSVANLMLSRFAQRRSEFAVRRALGASTWQLVRLMLSEALVIGLAGACLALGVARVAATLLTSELPITRGRVIEIRPELDASALLAISGAIVIAVLAFGLWPAVLTIRRERGLHLQHEIAKAQAGRRPTFDWLIRWQAVIATVFCLAAWACTEGVLSGIRRDSGMLIERLAIINLTSSERRADGSLSLGEERLVALRKAVADAPGVSAGSLALGLPFGINAPMVTISASVPGEAIKRSVQGIQIAAAEGFFDTTGIGILHGRGITDMDTARESSVAVLSESTAKELFGNTVANGRELHVKVAGSSESEAVTVIGIAKDTDVVRFAARKGAVIYRSLLQVRPPRSITVVARGKTDDVSSTLAAVEMVLNRIDVGLVIEGAGPGLLMLAGSLVLLRLLGILAMTLSVVAVLVAMAGLYGVISQQVASRRKEMATRYSLGAVPWRIRRLVLVEGVSPVAQGVLVGLLFGMALRAILRLILDVPVAVLDPVQSVGLAILLTSIAAIACYLPAYRASTVEPAVLLRAE
jgi:ABC-type antimicrobial peptide transport system permease subunit